MSFLWKLPQNALNCGKQDDMISPKHIFYQFQGILPSYNLNYISEIHAFNSLKIMKAGVLDKIKVQIVLSLLQNRRCCLWQKERIVKLQHKRVRMPENI